MATRQILRPHAASLTASMRDLGYSLQAAVADLIDNSITAESTEICIVCDLALADPVLVILDNGWGMTGAEVVAAMRHGATDPRKTRLPKDLGRFGLGLKTASFSQCRTLTVVSAKNGMRTAARWSLDLIEVEEDWIIEVLAPEEISALPYVDELGDTGTLVIWQDLDRLFEDVTGEKRNEVVNEKLTAVERHLSLVFHRFLSGDVKGRKRLSIRLNGGPVKAFDPFCLRNEATQILPTETVYVNNVAISMQPYILPHHSRLSQSEYDFYQTRSDFISNQGAYVYRNCRLMAWGDWFRLIPKGEATKLARVQIDFPNSLDEAWTIDIKKSRARPPHAVRDRLRQIIEKITFRSREVSRGRGQRLYSEIKAPFWERYASHEGIRYVVNNRHPLIEAVSNRLGDDERRSFDLMIESLGAALPVEMIYSDYSTHPRDFSLQERPASEVAERLRLLKQAIFGAGSVNPLMFRQVVASTHLFDSYTDLIEKFIHEEIG